MTTFSWTPSTGASIAATAWGFLCDASTSDASAHDASQPDAGPSDVGTPAGPTDGGTGQSDADLLDAGAFDAGPRDGSVHDASELDTGPSDAGMASLGDADAGSSDTDAHDATEVDASELDAFEPDAGQDDAACNGITIFQTTFFGGMIDGKVHAENSTFHSVLFARHAPTSLDMWNVDIELSVVCDQQMDIRLDEKSGIGCASCDSTDTTTACKLDGEPELIVNPCKTFERKLPACEPPLPTRRTPYVPMPPRLGK